MKLFNNTTPVLSTTFVVKYDKDTTLQVYASCKSLSLNYDVEGLQISFYNADKPEDLIDIPYSKDYFQVIEDMAVEALIQDTFGPELDAEGNEMTDDDEQEDESTCNVVKLH